MPAIAPRLALALVAAIVILLCEVVLDVAGRATAAGARAVPPSLVGGAVRRSDGTVELEEIGRVKRGKEHVLVVAQAGGSGLTCKLKLKYADGNADTPDDVVSDDDGICTMFFDVPDRRSVVGDAIAKLRVETRKGKLKGKDARSFSVKS